MRRISRESVFLWSSCHFLLHSTRRFRCARRNHNASSARPDVLRQSGLGPRWKAYLVGKLALPVEESQIIEFCRALQSTFLFLPPLATKSDTLYYTFTLSLKLSSNVLPKLCDLLIFWIFELDKQIGIEMLGFFDRRKKMKKRMSQHVSLIFDLHSKCKEKWFDNKTIISIMRYEL